MGERIAGGQRVTNYIPVSTGDQSNTGSASRLLRRSVQTLETTTTNDGNDSSTRPHKRPRGDVLMASDNSSSHNRCHELAIENGVSGYSKFESWVTISLNSKSKTDIEELKRKLRSELDQVRSLVRKLDAKDKQFSSYLGGELSQSQVSSNNVLEKVGNTVKVNSEVGSSEVPDGRQSQHGLTAENDTLGVKLMEKEKRSPKTTKHQRNTEHVLEKEKFFPPDSEANGGKGNASNLTSGFGMDKNLSSSFKSCSNLLSKLMKHKHGWVFNAPVDAKALGLYDYHKIIKKPMDLGTVQTRLNKNWYKSPSEFAEDVRLTFRNAMLYNPKGQDVHLMAEQFLKFFEEKWADIEARYTLNKRSRMDGSAVLPTSTSRQAAALVSPATPPPGEMMTMDKSEPIVKHPVEEKMGCLNRSESMAKSADSKMKSGSINDPCRTPVSKKPKAKDPEKRDMTFEEKQKLSTDLQSLPSEKLDNVVQIIKKRSQGLFQNDDEIEVDIASVDPETLWELDRFVTSYKKRLSKNKRKEANLAVATAGQHEDSDADSESGNSSAYGSDGSCSPEA